MRGSSAKAGVLYAPVEEVGSEKRLSRACRILKFLSTILNFASVAPFLAHYII